MDHIDQAAVLSLKEVMEDDFPLLMTTFLQDAEKRLILLSQLVGSDDADGIRRAAHSFKGSCGNVGAQLLASYCAHLEHKAANQDVGNIQEDVDRIREEFNLVKKIIEAL